MKYGLEKSRMTIGEGALPDLPSANITLTMISRTKFNKFNGNGPLDS